MKNFGCVCESYEIVGIIGSKFIVEDFVKEYDTVSIIYGQLFFGTEPYDKFSFDYNPIRISRKGKLLFIKVEFFTFPIIIVLNLRNEENAKKVKKEIIKKSLFDLNCYKGEMSPIRYIKTKFEIDGGNING